MTIGESIHKKRVEKNISIRRLAELSKVAPSTIWRLEKGGSMHHGATINSIAEALESSYEELSEL